MIERVCQGFLPLELHKFGIFWNLHQPKGVPISHFHQPTGFLGGAHLSVFINPKVYADSKKWQKTLVHSFYHILYQPKGCPPLGTTSLGQSHIKLKLKISHFWKCMNQPAITWKYKLKAYKKWDSFGCLEIIRVNFSASNLWGCTSSKHPVVGVCSILRIRKLKSLAMLGRIW